MVPLVELGIMLRGRGCDDRDDWDDWDDWDDLLSREGWERWSTTNTGACLLEVCTIDCMDLRRDEHMSVL